MEQNILVIKKKQNSLNRDKYGRAVIKITPEAADTIESFINESEVSVMQLASSMIEFAAPHTMVRQEWEE